jgi:hypothetical protein
MDEQTSQSVFEINYIYTLPWMIHEWMNASSKTETKRPEKGRNHHVPPIWASEKHNYKKDEKGWKRMKKGIHLDTSTQIRFALIERNRKEPPKRAASFHQCPKNKEVRQRIDPPPLKICSLGNEGLRLIIQSIINMTMKWIVSFPPVSKIL